MSKVFEVLIREYDLANNYDDFHYGYFEAESIEQVKETFVSDRAFVKFQFLEVNVKPLPQKETMVNCLKNIRRYR
jgi:hypothetical protein